MFSWQVSFAKMFQWILILYHWRSDFLFIFFFFETSRWFKNKILIATLVLHKTNKLLFDVSVFKYIYITSLCVYKHTYIYLYISVYFIGPSKLRKFLHCIWGFFGVYLSTILVVWFKLKFSWTLIYIFSFMIFPE